MTKSIDPRILAICEKVTGKRPRTVIDHILKHGFITTEELKDTYGYDHPPRAIRDVREAGVPLETFKVTASNGRKIGAYRFDNPDKIENHKLAGRQTFSKAFKKQLIEMYGEKCFISGLPYESRYLQIDHRVPYEVAGDNVAQEHQPEEFMLITATAQRQKSWSCENCVNLRETKSLEVCRTCYWAYPENYTHAATREIRQLSVEWAAEEVKDFEKIKADSETQGLTMQDFIKSKLK